MRGMYNTPGLVAQYDPIVPVKTDQERLYRLEDDYESYRKWVNSGCGDFDLKVVEKFRTQIEELRKIIVKS